jgi:glycosyltransferase involved in cell wall biosynthesis
MPCRAVDAAFRDAVFRDAAFRDAAFRDAAFRDAAFRDAVFRDAVFRDAVFRRPGAVAEGGAPGAVGGRRSVGGRRMKVALRNLTLAGLRRCPPLVADAAMVLPPLRRAGARLHEYQGHLRAAARLAGGDRSRYGARLTELATALDDCGLRLPAAPPTRLRRPFNKRVVMALYGSEPWFANGYSVRSRCLLQQLAAVGVDCVPVTRPNFPQDTAAGRDVPRGTEETFAGLRYRRLPAGPSLLDEPVGDYVRSFAGQLAEIMRASDAGIVHAASNHVVGLAACLAAEATGVPSVYEMRGLWHQSTATRWPGWESTETFALHEALEAQAALRADRVVVLSPALAEHVRGWGVPECRIAIVPNGVDPALFRPQPRDPALRTALGAGPDTFLVGFVGTFAPYEGLDTLLRAVALLRRQGVDAAAALVGAGEQEARLRRLAARLAVPAAFPGRVPFARVPAYLGAFDAHPFPRNAAPVTALVPPLKLAEAMACAVPVVVTGLAPLTEMVTHEHRGLVCGHGPEALAAALGRLHAAPDFAAGIAAAARDWVVEHRTWQAAAATLAAVYAGQPVPAAGIA